MSEYILAAVPLSSVHVSLLSLAEGFPRSELPDHPPTRPPLELRHEAVTSKKHDPASFQGVVTVWDCLARRDAR